jgi:hypothetical protein
MGLLREDVLRVALPLVIVLSTTITWAGDVKNPANDSLFAMSAKRQADILGKIVGEGCKGKTAYYQGTMKDLPQPKGDHRPQLPVPPEHENDTFWNVICKNRRSYSVEVHPDGSSNVLECGIVKMFHLVNASRSSEEKEMRLRHEIADQGTVVTGLKGRTECDDPH